MNKILTIMMLACLICGCTRETSTPLYDIHVTDNHGNDVSMDKYRGNVLLIVNTATHCGFTPQYAELDSLYDKYHAQGFEILDFPCNQFGEQAPGSDESIDTFCTVNYSTEFPRFAKIDVNGENASPLYVYLKGQKGFEGFDPENEMSPILERVASAQDPDYKSNSDIKWNFTKFLIDRNGNVVARFEPNHSMQDIEKSINNLL